MLTLRIITLILFFLTLYPAMGQTTEWKLTTQGNRAFQRKDYSQAEINYMNVLKNNPKNVAALFNLGNVQLAKGNAQAAFDFFQQCQNASQDKSLAALALHNQGYIYQATAMSSTKEDERQRALREAINYYKQSLRINPSDHNTRYNLALCQKLLKEIPSNNQQSQQSPEPQSADQQEQPNEQQEQQEQQQNSNDKQTQQLLNLAKQAEKRAKEKVDKAMRNRRPKNLEKNW